MCPRYHIGGESEWIHFLFEGLWCHSSPLSTAGCQIPRIHRMQSTIKKQVTGGRRWSRRTLFAVGAVVLLSQAACANQGAVSSPAEPLSVRDNPGAIVRLAEQR